MSETQSFARMLQENWSEITGWGLILSGLSLATWALGARKAPQAAPPGRASRMVPIRTIDPPRRLDRADEWRILIQIAERGFLCIEVLAAMQDRAREEVEAADEALSLLLADCAAVLTPAGAAPGFEGDQTGIAATEPAPANATRPLAA